MERRQAFSALGGAVAGAALAATQSHTAAFAEGAVPEVKVCSWREADVAEVEVTFKGITDPKVIAEITQAIRDGLGFTTVPGK